ncbi:MAG: NAD(P)/FAD-dependent oxidoreductase [bacterium]|nr:NAD(P)/FAD-dependent oxidoreductase [bacterium]
MRYLIIGNGIAGTNAAKKIRDLDKEASVSVLTDESYPYYTRPKLINYLASKITEDKLFVYKSDWYRQNNIKLYLNSCITEINRKNKFILDNKNNKFHYDKMLLAVGSSAAKIPVTGSDNSLVLTLRCLDDARHIIDLIKKRREIIVIGGGLLGLEVADSLKGVAEKVQVIEISDHLLSYQLNEKQGKNLEQKLKHKGIIFYLNEICRNIENYNNKLVVTTENNTTVTGDLIIMSTGIKARKEVASAAGLHTDKGIVVNKYLQTSDESIYAAGDCIQLGGKTWGFVKSSVEQAFTAAENMVYANKSAYKETKIDPTIKVTGINLKEL